MAEQEVKANIEGEAEEHEYIEDEEEKLSQEGEEDEEEEEEEEEEDEEKPVKKRRCQKRKKIRQIIFDDDGEEDEEEEDLVEDVELLQETEEEGEESEESDHVSYTSSVLSAISFVWENEVYEFEELCDFGIFTSFYEPELSIKESLTHYGVQRYLEMCNTLNIYPMGRIIHSLQQEEMDLSHCNVNSKNIRAMCAALEINNSVRRLIMRYNKLKVDDCYWLGLMLRSNGTISHMDFTGCRMGAEGLELLIANLSKNECLENFYLSKCNIQDEGMKLLAYVLMQNNSIQNLDLSYNNLGEEAGDALASAFKINSSVNTLILRYNNLFYPPPMNAFFRALASNNSISYLDLSWNGLSGTDMGGYIGNFLRRNTSIRFLDLSDNRFQGPAVLQIKKGMAKSRSLETLKLGKNPMSPADLSALLGGVKGNEFLKVLDFEDLWVEKPFVKTLNKISQSKEVEVNYAGVFSNYQVFGPDYPQVILKRAQFEAQKPKKAKAKRDFGHLIWTLGDEPLTTDEFMKKVKKFKAKINKELFPELIKQFTIPKVQLIDVAAMREKYLSIYPDSQPPPPPPPKKGKKGKKMVDSEEKEKPVESTVEAKVEKPLEDATELVGTTEEDEGEAELVIDGTEEEEEEMIVFGGTEEEEEEELILNNGDEENVEGEEGGREEELGTE